MTYGLLNLTPRDAHTKSKQLEPGTRQRVQLRLHGAALVFPAGNRIQMALSTSYWPLAWVATRTGADDRPPRRERDRAASAPRGGPGIARRTVR
ncbi:CocE/NonD family hydrolase C-terminal non-catalytic domain-containing protein [Salinifilum ghardaiensis]